MRTQSCCDKTYPLSIVSLYRAILDGRHVVPKRGAWCGGAASIAGVCPDVQTHLVRPPRRCRSGGSVEPSQVQIALWTGTSVYLHADSGNHPRTIGTGEFEISVGNASTQSRVHCAPHAQLCASTARSFTRTQTRNDQSMTIEIAHRGRTAVIIETRPAISVNKQGMLVDDWITQRARPVIPHIRQPC
jgi:hypothetical protein